MVDFFYKLYCSTLGNNIVFNQIHFYSFERYLIRISANLFLPFYFRLSSNKKNSISKGNIDSGKKNIVSLTTFPKRIGKVWLVIETILRQSVRPDAIILWLSIEQFPSLNALPHNLLRLQKKGLIIRLCEGDLRSHKKYYYALKEFPNYNIITVDDDVFYPSYLLQKLIDKHREYPKAVIANHTRSIEIKDDVLLPYAYWKISNSNCISEESTKVQIGVGGVLYPPGSLNDDVLLIDVFKRICFLADDIWLFAMARMNGTQIIHSSLMTPYLPIMYKNNRTLASKNLHENLNDAQIKAVREYCLKRKNIDPFV